MAGTGVPNKTPETVAGLPEFFREELLQAMAKMVDKSVHPLRLRVQQLELQLQAQGEQPVVAPQVLPEGEIQFLREVTVDTPSTSPVGTSDAVGEAMKAANIIPMEGVEPMAAVTIHLTFSCPPARWRA